MLSDDPLWFKDAILYEVHVRAFADSDGDGIGDFNGLTEKLDYLRDLGIDALWLLPFYPSPLRDGGYDIGDYYGIHPDYGTKDDFLRFLEAAHARNLRVITELVINHTSVDHPWFERARSAPPGSVERDFYVWSDTPDRYGAARIIFKDFEQSNWAWDEKAGAYYWHRFYSHQPDLNFDNPAVHEALFQVLDHWLGLGVDGVRLDAIPYLYEREGTSCENLPETHAFLKKLRARVDAKFGNRMLLAEANQWPADAASYFGDGDECHMNFHFPLMPRLFMAVNLEDSFPIVDILAQTPDIPPTCQWATFLRNHDELTLEMVTEEDRDYMYRVYAKEHRARINLGIRRRLAPLLGDRRRVELLNAILFTLPGTPVVYYGDELGMGDNIYLGDRDGVRTPMQWSSDRNAGFSRVNPQRLYLPVVVDPQYHFEAINVEAQQADPASLLWWMKYLIHTRKSRRLFSRGAIRFVEHDNPKVLAFVRELDGEQLLFVANLSRFAQHADLLMGDFLGKQPREVLGKGRFPRIETERWGLSLGPYGYIWLDLLPPQLTEMRVRAPLTVDGAWWNVAQRGDDLALRLAHYAFHHKWYRGSERERSGESLREVFTLESDGERFLLTLVSVEHAGAQAEVCVLPVAYAHGTAARELEAASPDTVLSSLVCTRPGEAKPETGALFDAATSRAFSARVLRAAAAGEAFAGAAGALTFRREPGLLEAIGAGSVDPRRIDHGQTNTIVFYGAQLVLKMLHTVDEGVNAEAETLRFLGRNAHRRLAPRLLGAASFRPDGGGEETLIAMFTEYVPNRGTARELFADALRTYVEHVLAIDEPPPPSPQLLDGAMLVPDTWAALAAPLPSLAELLGQRTAELHRTLGSRADDPAFAPESFDVLHQQSLHQSARGLVTRTLAQVRGKVGTLDHEDRDLALGLLAREHELYETLHSISMGSIDTVRIRSHGDLHLGQVLFTGDDFVFIDFEGETGRPLRERRYKRCPLRDVATMVRSLELSAEATLREGRVRQDDRARVEPWLEAWSKWLATIFVETWVRELGDTRLAPRERSDARRLLRFYLIERCFQELAREISERPHRVGASLSGIARLLGSDWTRGH